MERCGATASGLAAAGRIQPVKQNAPGGNTAPAHCISAPETAQEIIDKNTGADAEGVIDDQFE